MEIFNAYHRVFNNGLWIVISQIQRNSDYPFMFLLCNSFEKCKKNVVRLNS